MNAESKSPVLPHNFTHTGTEVLILRRCGKDRKAHGGFTYPTGVGSLVEAPDFSPEVRCGGGLHGWPWSFGLGEGQDFDVSNDVWLILGAAPADVVGELEGGWKCKCRKATIRFEGQFKDAMDFLRGGFTACVRAMAASLQGDYAKNASAGDSATNASAGDSATNASAGNSATNASAGDSATNASAGDSATNASAGDSAKNASAGNSATNASAGNSAKNASAGDYAKNASAGDSAKNASAGNSAKNASAGDSATNASAGDSATNASAGNSATNASAGDSATNASAGDSATNASAGYGGSIEACGENSTAAAANEATRVKVAKGGAFALACKDADGTWRFICGKAGEDGIKADTWYSVDAHTRKLVEG